MKEQKLNKFRSKLHGSTAAGYIFSSPFIIGFLAVTLIPMLVSLYYSFTNYSLISKDVGWVGLENYIRLFTDERFHKSLRVTLVYVGTLVPLKLAFALLIAYLLTQKRKGTAFYRSLFYLPSLIGGSIAVTLVWKNMFARKGLINTVLASMGAETVSWFGDQKLAMVPLVLMAVWQFGSSMIIFAAGLKEVPLVYYEAAKIDGANEFKRFFRITLPCISPIILYNLVMQTIAGFMSFTQAFVITGGGPNDATNFYALYVYKHAFTYKNMGYASALSWVMLVAIAAITLLIFMSSKFWVFNESDS
jgi:multiple sugar transport system permease protein